VKISGLGNLGWFAELHRGGRAWEVERNKMRVFLVGGFFETVIEDGDIYLAH
jgi:hypothetical protein